MGRPKKNNADYFSHDSEMRNHRKIKALRSKFGFMGYGVFNMLLEVLTDAEGNRLELSDIELELLAGDFDLSVTELREVIDFCVRLNLFAKDGDKLYSEELDKRLKSVYEKRKRAQKAAESKNRDEDGKFTETSQIPGIRQKDDTEKPQDGHKADISATETPQQNISVTKTPQSKVKESKVKESIKEKNREKEKRLSKIQKEFYDHLIPYTTEFGKETLREFYNYWSEPNKARTKIKWQLEKTWDTKRRLQRWVNNDFGNKPNKPEKEVQIWGKEL